MRGRLTLEYLLSGGVLQLKDSVWLYRFTECLEAKSLEEGSSSLNSEFNPISSSLDWILEEEFVDPEGFPLSYMEAMTATTYGCTVQSEVSMFEYSYESDVMATYLDGVAICGITEVSDEEMKGGWKTIF